MLAFASNNCGILFSDPLEGVLWRSSGERDEEGFVRNVGDRL